MQKLIFPLSFNHCQQANFSAFSLSNPLLPYTPSRRHTRTTVPSLWAQMESVNLSRPNKEKLIAIVGATGSGKSRLAVDLANVFSAEIVNSDKMQFYKDLPITTNQITPRECRGVPHHLIGELDPYDGELSAADFRSLAADAISGITSHGKIPILAGGSNSFVHALLTDRFEPDSDPFTGSGSVSLELRYECCFLWVDVELSVLFDYLSKRVDEMLDSGLLEELAEFYDPNNEPGDSENRTGLWKAIGVPEFDQYFRKYPPEQKRRNVKNVYGENGGCDVEEEWNPVRREAYERAVKEMKENTHQLAKRQLGKILRLREAGWDIRRLDATASFRERLTPSENGARKSREIWEKEVLEPGVNIVKQFLEE